MNYKKLIYNLAIPWAVGGLSAFLCRNSFQALQSLAQPPLSPPPLVFSIVWSILYTLMGIGCYQVATSDARIPLKKKAYLYYGIQLFLNFIWSPIYFIYHNFLLALIVLGTMYFFIWQMYQTFKDCRKSAGQLQIPYLLWSSFAIYLNVGVLLLN